MKELFLLGAVFLAVGFFHIGTASAAKCPRVMVLATGGTIAGRELPAAGRTGYKAGVLSVGDLIADVPELREIADVTGEQLCNIDSKDMTDEIWLRLAARVNEIFAADAADAVVIPHGTDTMEETAYFLSLTVKSDKPVVLTGAMRPATAADADGFENLLDAVRVSASGDAVGKGVLVVMNGEIHEARDVTKIHTQNLAAFASPTTSCLGTVKNGVPAFSRAPLRRPKSEALFDLGDVSALPRVDILYGHEGDDGALAFAAEKAGAKGLVYAGMGNGSIPTEAEKALAKIAGRGVIVVRASRSCGGEVTSSVPFSDEAGFIESGALNPQKARVLLRLCLAKMTDAAEIARTFAACR
ncbi:MAG: asparaginase [Schwartzia succinivorans]|nr:asparaginase [Schwartzia succinivorans]